MMNLLLEPWPWYVAGPIISIVMFSLIYFGGNFGMSSNLRTMCSIGGAGKFVDFFKIDWKGQLWNLAFVLGSIIGGFIAYRFMTPEVSIQLSEATINKLSELGFADAGNQYLPEEIFGMEQITSISGLSILLLGGILVGFGTRYAGGCTSGHAISGLSNLQLPSLIAVIGFFIGGLLMVHVVFPYIY